MEYPKAWRQRELEQGWSRWGRGSRQSPALRPTLPGRSCPPLPAFALCRNSQLHQACLPLESVPFPKVEPQDQDTNFISDVPPGKKTGKHTATDPVLPTNLKLGLFTPNVSKEVHERRGDAGWILTMSSQHLMVLLSISISSGSPLHYS